MSDRRRRRPQARESWDPLPDQALATIEAMASRARIEQILRARDFSLVFQPIFELGCGEAHATSSAPGARV